MERKEYLPIKTPDEYNGYRDKIARILEAEPHYGLLDRWDIVAIDRELIGGTDVYLRGYTKGHSEFIRLTFEIDLATGEWEIRDIARPQWRAV